MVTLVVSRRAIGEKVCAQRSHQESELTVGTDFGQNSKPKIVFKFPRNACFPLVTAYTHTMLVFYGPWFTFMQCLLFIDHILHSHGAYFSLAMIYTHTMLVLHWVIILLILSTAGCDCQQHPSGSLLVKVIYYIFPISK